MLHFVNVLLNLNVFAGDQVSPCYEEGSGIFGSIYGEGERGHDVRIISGPGQFLLACKRKESVVMVVHVSVFQELLRGGAGC